MLKRLFRQRRRLIFLALMLALSVALAHSAIPDLRYEIKHGMAEAPGQSQLSAAIVGGVAVLLGGVFVVLVLPAWRRLLEVFGITFVLIELLARAQGVLPAWLSEGAGPLILYMVVYVLVAIALERDVFAALGLRMRLRMAATGRVNATPEAVWAATAPDAETTGTYWTGALQQVEARPDLGLDVVEARFAMGPPLSMVQRQTRQIWERPLHFAYDFEPADGVPGVVSIHGRYEMRCAPQDDGRTAVTLSHSYPRLGFGTWFLLWLDDVAGSELDAIAARLEGRRDRSVAGWSARKMAGA